MNSLINNKCYTTTEYLNEYKDLIKEKLGEDHYEFLNDLLGNGGDEQYVSVIDQWIEKLFMLFIIFFSNIDKYNKDNYETEFALQLELEVVHFTDFVPTDSPQINHYFTLDFIYERAWSNLEKAKLIPNIDKFKDRPDYFDYRLLTDPNRFKEIKILKGE